MLNGKTKSGFEFQIDERLINDQRLLRLIVKSESEDASEKVIATEKLYTFLLGEKGYDDLIEHVMKNNDGFCPADVIGKEFLEIMNSAKDLKNLYSSPT